MIVSVGYTNSPEAKFPLPLEQCYQTLLWLCEQASYLHVDSSRVAVIGDSAGGNMAAALTLLARDRKGPAINLQILINPALDLHFEKLADFVGHYLSCSEDANSPYASPLLADDLSRLPPALSYLGRKGRVTGGGAKVCGSIGCGSCCD